MKHLNQFDTTLRTSGAGGAHIGFFGRSRMLMGPEDDARGGGGGAAGAPPGNTGGQPANGTSEAGTAPPEGRKTFDQEQVNRIVADRLAEDRTRREREQQQQAPRDSTKKPKSTDDGDTVAELRAKLDQMDLRNAFDKRAAKFDLSESMEGRLFKLFAADKPSDPAAWWADAIKDFGLKSSTATNNQTTKTGDPDALKQAPGPSTSDKGGAAAPSGTDPESVLRERKPSEWTQSDIARIHEKNGEEKGNDIIAAAVRVHLKGMKVIADPRRLHKQG